MYKTYARMADGRQLIYFDRAQGAPRVLQDPRDLTPVATMSSVRFDPLTEEWVVLAGHRQDRTHLPPDQECPLCPSRPGHQTEIPSPDYEVVVFENRFASFPASAEPDGQGAPVGGRCEVVCFAPDHHASFSSLAPAHVAVVVDAWIDRTVALSSLPHVEQVFCFENRGREIGVTLSHPHGQIYAYPFVTPRTTRILDSARRYRQRTSRSLFADVVAEEVKAGVRLVTRSAHWTAFVPRAARWPVEVHLYPNRPVAALPDLDSAQRDDLASMYPEILRRVEGAVDDTVPYVAAWHQAPAGAERDLGYLHCEVYSIRRAPGRIKYLAGSESAMDVFVNDVTPEAMAGRLRDVAR